MQELLASLGMRHVTFVAAVDGQFLLEKRSGRARLLKPKSQIYQITFTGDDGERRSQRQRIPPKGSTVSELQ